MELYQVERYRISGYEPIEGAVYLLKKSAQRQAQRWNKRAENLPLERWNPLMYRVSPVQVRTKLSVIVPQGSPCP